MDRLLRDIAPLSERGWGEIESEARRTLRANLAARRLVDFTGPKGWDFSAVDSAQGVPNPLAMEGGVRANVRRVQPLMELRRTFDVPRTTIDAIDRGARNADLDMVVEAAQAVALAEDRLVFYGDQTASILGICTGAAEAALPIREKYEDNPALVATALSKLRESGVDGPFALALGKRCYTGLTETTKEGYPVLQHVQRLITGPIVWAPAVNGAVVLSMRGDDFELIVGQDLSIGYLSHDNAKVTLYLEESLTVRLLSPQAAVPLEYREARERRSARGAEEKP